MCSIPLRTVNLVFLATDPEREGQRIGDEISPPRAPSLAACKTVKSLPTDDLESKPPCQACRLA